MQTQLTSIDRATIARNESLYFQYEEARLAGNFELADEILSRLNKRPKRSELHTAFAKF